MAISRVCQIIVARHNKLRAYVNFETEQVRILLEMIAEVNLSRDLTSGERYLRETLLGALKECLKGGM
jgi:hypothetical protein